MRIKSVRGSGLLLALSTLILMTGCSSYRLYGRVERMSPGTSIHEILETPQPVDWKQPTGQRLVVSWILPRFKYSKDKLALHIDVVFSKGVHEIVEMRPISRWGHWTYDNSGDQIKERGHIATYKIWITEEGKEIQVFRHKLYREWLDPDQVQDESKI